MPHSSIHRIQGATLVVDALVPSTSATSFRETLIRARCARHPRIPALTAHQVAAPRTALRRSFCVSDRLAFASPEHHTSRKPSCLGRQSWCQRKLFGAAPPFALSTLALPACRLALHSCVDARSMTDHSWEPRRAHAAIECQQRWLTSVIQLYSPQRLARWCSGAALLQWCNARKGPRRGDAPIDGMLFNIRCRRKQLPAACRAALPTV